MEQDHGISASSGMAKEAMTNTRLRLCVMATSDLHAHLQPYDYYTDKPQINVGLARVASLIQQTRGHERNTLLLDNGDTFQGTPLGDFAIAERVTKDRAHPMVTAMNSLRYDAMTLGNHDFNFGLPNLERIMEHIQFPIVLANILRADGTAFLPHHVILDRRVVDDAGQSHNIKIGLLGVTPPQVMKWDHALLEGHLIAEDILSSVTRSVASLKEDGADIIIALCHSGMGSGEALPDQENAAIAVARIDGIDALVAGHTHEVFPNPANATQPHAKKDSAGWADHEAGTVAGKPMVQPGSWGTHLGRLTLELAQSPQGNWVMRGGRGDVIAVSQIDENKGTPQTQDLGYPMIMRGSAEDHMATLGFVRRKIGETTAPLESFFSLISNSAIVKLVADAQRDAARSLLMGQAGSDLPLLSAAAPFKSGGRGGPTHYTDIASGPLAIRNAADLYYFPNMLQVLKINGDGLKNWLERVASAFFQIDRDSTDQTLIDPSFAGYNFDVIDGLTYEIDVTRPRCYSGDGETRFDTEGRVFNICHDGKPIQPDQEFLIATNTYRGSGGGHFTAPTQAETVMTDNRNLRDILVDHIAQAGVIDPAPTTAWRFAPQGGLPVLFETGPAALDHPARVENLGLSHVGFSQSGFAQFRLNI